MVVNNSIMHCNVTEKLRSATVLASIAQFVSDSLAFLFLSISWCVELRYNSACHESPQLTFHVTSQYAIITGWSSSLSLLMCGSKHFWQRFMLWFPRELVLAEASDMWLSNWVNLLLLTDRQTDRHHQLVTGSNLTVTRKNNKCQSCRLQKNSYTYFMIIWKQNKNTMQ